MKRKDLVFAAVLINVALFALLFVLASPIERIKTAAPEMEEVVVLEKVEKTPSMPPPPVVQDALDEVVQAFVQRGEEDKECVEVTVKRGDYLEKIAKAHGVSIRAIIEANGLKNEQIRIGQVLKIPKEIYIEAVFPIGFEYEKRRTRKAKIDLDNILYFNEYGEKKMKKPKEINV